VVTCLVWLGRLSLDFGLGSVSSSPRPHLALTSRVGYFEAICCCLSVQPPLCNRCLRTNASRLHTLSVPLFRWASSPFTPCKSIPRCGPPHTNLAPVLSTFYINIARASARASSTVLRPRSSLSPPAFGGFLLTHRLVGNRLITDRYSRTRLNLRQHQNLHPTNDTLTTTISKIGQPFSG
jgi:hypothetical protein